MCRDLARSWGSGETLDGKENFCTGRISVVGVLKTLRLKFLAFPPFNNQNNGLVPVSHLQSICLKER